MNLQLHKNELTQKRFFFSECPLRTLIQPDYVTADKRLLSTCILKNILIAAF